MHWSKKKEKEKGKGKKSLEFKSKPRTRNNLTNTVTSWEQTTQKSLRKCVALLKFLGQHTHIHISGVEAVWMVLGATTSMTRIDSPDSNINQHSDTISPERLYFIWSLYLEQSIFFLTVKLSLPSEVWSRNLQLEKAGLPNCFPCAPISSWNCTARSESRHPKLPNLHHGRRNLEESSDHAGSFSYLMCAHVYQGRHIDPHEVS